MSRCNQSSGHFGYIDEKTHIEAMFYGSRAPHIYGTLKAIYCDFVGLTVRALHIYGTFGYIVRFEF